MVQPKLDVVVDGSGDQEVVLHYPANAKTQGFLLLDCFMPAILTEELTKYEFEGRPSRRSKAA